MLSLFDLPRDAKNSFSRISNYLLYSGNTIIVLSNLLCSVKYLTTTSQHSLLKTELQLSGNFIIKKSSYSLTEKFCFKSIFYHFNRFIRFIKNTNIILMMKIKYFVMIN